MRGVKGNFNDEGLDELYRSTPPGTERTLLEIAQAAGVKRQAIFYIEKTALSKIRAEMVRRRIRATNIL